MLALESISSRNETFYNARITTKFVIANESGAKTVDIVLKSKKTKNTHKTIQKPQAESPLNYLHAKSNTGKLMVN